jgi:hypothetical protein
MYHSIALGAIVLLTSVTSWADRAPTEEETIAPLVMKQNCWDGIIRFIMEDRRFEVDDAVCGDGNFYHLEFDAGLRLIEKRMVRLPYCKTLACE